MKYDVGVNASIAMQNTLLEGDQSSAGSRTELAYQVLRSEILRGALLPGQRLRAADLEARVSLGLTPIREALMLANLQQGKLTAPGLSIGLDVTLDTAEEILAHLRQKGYAQVSSDEMEEGVVVYHISGVSRL